MDLAADLAAFRSDVQTAVDDFVERHSADVLAVSDDLASALQALSDLLAGGKRLRAACSHWGYIAAGGANIEASIRAASCLELLQASALIHDDVMDNSDTRRGQPAVHRRFAANHQAAEWHGSAEGFGRAAAILIGDLALVWSDMMLRESGFAADAISRAEVVFDAMRTELMAGQFLDVLEQARGGGSVARALRVVRYKTTAYTIERPLHLGAALADAPAAVHASYTAFGEPLGEAFQLRDDLLGVFGDPSLTGKPAGDDIREGKRTVLLAIAQERADAGQRADLEALVGMPTLDSPGLERVRTILRDTGAVAEVESQITSARNRAFAALDVAPLTDHGRDALRGIAIAATERSA